MSNKRIKPEDGVTITTTYGELAAVYAVLGTLNGKTFGRENLWLMVRDILGDNSQEKYWTFFGDGTCDRCEKYGIQYIDYHSWQKEWINHLFPQETEQEKKIRELEETIAQATKQIEELRGLNQ